MRRFGYPIGILIIGGWVIRILQSILTDNAEIIIVKFAIATLCFSFGLSLNTVRKRRNTWVKKLLVSFVLLFFILWDLGYLVFPGLSSFMHFLALDGFIVYLVYVFCGWTFFD